MNFNSPSLRRISVSVVGLILPNYRPYCIIRFSFEFLQAFTLPVFSKCRWAQIAPITDHTALFASLLNFYRTLLRRFSVSAVRLRLLLIQAYMLKSLNSFSNTLFLFL